MQDFTYLFQHLPLYLLRAYNEIMYFVVFFFVTLSFSVGDFTSSAGVSKKQDKNGRKYDSRNTEHVQNILHVQDSPTDEVFTNEILKKLVTIYNSAIKPLEVAYKFNDISLHSVGEGEIFAVPRIVFVGPWSTGKSSLINYLLDIENSSLALISGAQPTTSDFTVLTYENEHKTVEGSVLVMDSSYSSLEKFGHKFLERLESIRMPRNVLKRVNFIDTPGIIENRKQQERGYPFADVCQWFVDRSDLVILVFDPTKLDVGVELEVLFRQLKEHEAKVRIVLNKADTLTSQELLRVYGTLFWSLAPLINITEPPRVYIGSFWSKQFRPVLEDFQQLFIQEEISLVQDIFDVMCNRIQSKIAFLRKHAVMVRNHALVVDEYLKALRQHRSIFRDVNDIALSIMYAPDEYKIFQKVLAHSDVSKLDLFTQAMYRNFFSIHSMEAFLPLSKQCGFVSSCLLDSINYAIHHSLPEILDEWELTKKYDCLKSKMQNYNANHEKEKYFKNLNV